ncbi:MAG: hypothetical protein H7199_01960 [Burkholderiales bacterium]|nr:hypothetical protein [Flavobacterium sp.]
MSTNAPGKAENQEVDLSMISKGIGNFFQNIGTLLFKAIQFIIKHIIVILILFVIGVGLGLYLDKNNKTYDHQIIVQPNFGSTDYLYAKIDLIESKIKERDTLFLKAIGIQDAEMLSKIEIKPVIDVYRFINTSEQNFELLKLMAEDSDIKKIVEEKPTSKNYPYHLISFRTKKVTNANKTIAPLLNFLNNSAFYTKIQKEYVNNEMVKMKANELTIAQIDGFLNSFTNPSNQNAKNDKLVYYNENSPLNDVIETKDKLIKEQGNLRIDLVGLDKIIKENSSTLNTENNESINGKLKLILPLLFILIYISIFGFIGFYKNQKAISKQ